MYIGVAHVSCKQFKKPVGFPPDGPELSFKSGHSEMTSLALVWVHASTHGSHFGLNLLKSLINVECSGIFRISSQSLSAKYRIT